VEEFNWILFANQLNYKFILILQDLEDYQVYPVYFNSIEELDNYKNNIISESKVKFIKQLNL